MARRQVKLFVIGVAAFGAIAFGFVNWTGVRDNVPTTRAELSRATLAIFQTPSEWLSPVMQTKIRAIGGASARHLNLQDAEYARTKAGGAWVLKGGGVICIVRAGKGSLACGASTLVIQRGLALGTFTPPRRPTGKLHGFRILGIAPTWADRVELKVGKRRLRVTPSHGVYGVRAEIPISIARYLPR